MAIIDGSNKVINGKADIDGNTISFSASFEKNGIRYVLSLNNEEGEPMTHLSDDGVTTSYSCPSSYTKTKKQVTLALMSKCLDEDVKPFVNN